MWFVLLLLSYYSILYPCISHTVSHPRFQRLPDYPLPKTAEGLSFLRIYSSKLSRETASRDFLSLRIRGGVFSHYILGLPGSGPFCSSSGQPGYLVKRLSKRNCVNQLQFKASTNIGREVSSSRVQISLCPVSI